MEPGKTKRTSFIIQNAGGPYTRIWFSNPNSWVRVVDYRSMTASEELPLEVVIEARGLDWGESATEHIRVKLDEEETTVTAEIQTKPKPAAKPKPKPKPPPKTKRQPPPAQSSPKPKRRRFKPAVLTIASLAVVSVLLVIGIDMYHSRQDKIVFMSDRDGSEELYLINADGSNLVRLSYTGVEGVG